MVWMAKAFDVVSYREGDLCGVVWIMVAVVGGAMDMVGADEVFGIAVELTDMIGVCVYGEVVESGE